jgi:hypothetical protein
MNNPKTVQSFWQKWIMRFNPVNFKPVQGEKNTIKDHEKWQETGKQTYDGDQDQGFPFQKDIIRKKKE